MRQIKLIIAALFLISPFAANADLIDTNGPSTGSNSSIPGVSLTTGAGGPWNDILFNFYNTDGTAEASGDLFLLTSTYAGTPDALSSGTLGFLAQSISAIGGMWQFDTSVILNASTQYWFFVGTGFSWDTPAGRGGNQSLGENACFAGSELSNYNCLDGNGGQWDYQLQGAVTSVPEPGTLALFGLGLFGMGLARRNKKA